MTDQATPGAAQAGTPEGANTAGVQPGASPPAVADTFAGLQDAGNREWVANKGYKDLDTLTTSARRAETLDSELSGLKAKSLTPPTADAKPEEWDAFYAKLGRPEKPEAYEFNMPQNLPEGFAYDAESAKAYRGWAHEAGLNPRQAQALHDRFVSHQAQAQTDYVKAIVQKGEAAQTELVKVWGDKDSDGFKASVQYADRFINQNGGDTLLGELKANGLISPDGYILSPVLAQAFAKAGKALYAEGSYVSGGVPTQRQSLEQRLFPNG